MNLRGPAAEGDSSECDRFNEASQWLPPPGREAAAVVREASELCLVASKHS